MIISFLILYRSGNINALAELDRRDMSGNNFNIELNARDDDDEILV